MAIMNWTIRSFLFVLVISVPVYSYLTFSNWGLLFGNLAEVGGLSFAFLNFMTLLSFYDRSHPLRTVFAQLAFGMFIWLLGQCLEIYCELVLRLIAYGTVSDPLWVLGYFPLLFGFHNILIYRKKEENLSGWKMFRSILIGGILLYAAMFLLLILPQLKEKGQPLEQAILDFCYPTLDFILVVQCAMLLRITKKGSRFFPFALLSFLGFVFTLIGDGILSLIKDFQSFVYLSVDVYYFVCYFFLAIAAQQYARRLSQTMSPAAG